MEKKQQETQSEGLADTKKSYHPPRLEKHRSVQEVVLSTGTGAVNDANGGGYSS